MQTRFPIGLTCKEIPSAALNEVEGSVEKAKSLNLDRLLGRWREPGFVAAELGVGFFWGRRYGGLCWSCYLENLEQRPSEGQLDSLGCSFHGIQQHT